MLKDVMISQGHWLFRWRSYLPLLIVPVALNAFYTSDWMVRAFGPQLEDLWDGFCLFVALMGLSCRVANAGLVPRGTSGRNVHRQEAAQLNTTGMYSLVRHPLYLANFLIFLSFILLLKSAVFTLLATVSYVAYYERIILAEEDFLERSFGPAYRAWSGRTPAVIPNLRGWVTPELPFSWRTALRREFHTVFLIAGVFFINELLEAVVLERQTVAAWVHQEPIWAWFAATSGVFYLIVMAIKKRTHWLDVPNR